MTAPAPQWMNASHTCIDLVLHVSGIGDVPFTASILDPEAFGREIFERATRGEFGPIAEFVPPLADAGSQEPA